MLLFIFDRVYKLQKKIKFQIAFVFLRHTRRHYGNTHGKSNVLTSGDLTSFMYQVARGMDYLSSRGVSSKAGLQIKNKNKTKILIILIFLYLHLQII